MKYWVFINNEISGPFKLNDIINSKYFSKDLLLCPYEMDGIKPSNWYFAKELPEFEPYIHLAKVAVKDINDIDFDLDLIFQQNNFDISDYNEKEKYYNLPLKNEISILEEKLFQSEKEIEHYKGKINYLEEKISNLQGELDKTIKRLKEYEDKLKERDNEVEKLLKEVSDLKKNKELVIKYEKEIAEKDKKIKDIEEKLSIFQEKTKEFEVKLYEKSVENKELKEIINTFNEEKNLVDNKTEAYKEKIDFEKTIEETDYNKNEEITDKDLEKKTSDFVVNLRKDEQPILNQEESVKIDSKSKDFAPKVVEEKLSNSINVFENKDFISQNYIESESSLEGFDPFKNSKKLTPLTIDDNENSINEVENSLDNLGITQGYLKSSSFEKVDINNIFQTADIKLEVVKPNLDFIENKLEDVSNLAINIEETKLGKEDIPEISKVANPLETQKEEKILENISKPELAALDQKSDTLLDLSKEVGNLKEEKEENELEMIQSTTNNYNEVLLKKEDIIVKNDIDVREDKKENIKKDKEEETKVLEEKTDKTDKKSILVSSLYRKKISPAVKIIVFGIFILFFGGSIIYILNSGSDKNTINISKQNLKYPKVDDKNELPVNDEKVNSSIVSSTKAVDDTEINVSKINENVRKSIDIVKNFDLGNGRGNIEKWFSNSFSNKSVKEEWNATYLNGSLFVVQYRALRYRQEPIVYLFEVDVDKEMIVRGINNNAIDLLSSKLDVYKTTNKKTAKANIKDKKIVEEVKNNSEIF